MKSWSSVFLALWSLPALANSSRTITVHAHRGGAALYPENTLSAFRNSLRLGVDYIETDLRYTADGRIVLFHDSEASPKKCLNAEGKKLEPGYRIAQHSLAEIQSLDCGSLIPSDFPKRAVVSGERPASLRELLELVASTQDFDANAARVRLHLEIKTDRHARHPSPDVFAEAIWNELVAWGLQNRVIVESMDARYSQAFRAVARRAGVNVPRFVSPKFSWLSARLIKWLHDWNFVVAAWTVNDVAEWELMTSLGVDGLITDDPEALIDWLRQKGLR